MAEIPRSEYVASFGPTTGDRIRLADTDLVLPEVVSGNDHDRVVRLFRELQALADQRSRAYNAVNAGSIEEYRKLADKPEEPRILLLLDDIESFRDTYEFGSSRGAWFAIFEQLLSEGRALGIHVVFTADRAAAVTGGISASVPRRVVLRLVDKQAYLQLNAQL